MLFNDSVYNAVSKGLGAGEGVVPLAVLDDLFNRLAGTLGNQL